MFWLYIENKKKSSKLYQAYEYGSNLYDGAKDWVNENIEDPFEEWENTEDPLIEWSTRTQTRQ